MFDVHTGPRTTFSRRRKTAHRSAFGCVVDGDVIVRLEETHLANLVHADTRSSDVRDRSGRKLESRICCVDFVCEDRDADGVNVRNLDVFADEPLHDIEIVNHQIEHDVDVERARRKLAHPMDLEVDRLVDVWTQRDHRGIETFEMTDLKNRLAAL